MGGKSPRSVCVCVYVSMVLCWFGKKKKKKKKNAVGMKDKLQSTGGRSRQLMRQTGCDVLMRIGLAAVEIGCGQRVW